MKQPASQQTFDSSLSAPGVAAEKLDEAFVLFTLEKVWLLKLGELSFW